MTTRRSRLSATQHPMGTMVRMHTKSRYMTNLVAHVEEFLVARCWFDTDDVACNVSARDFRDAYITWCAQHGIAPLTPKRVGALLTARGCERGKFSRSNTWHWFGIGLC